MRTSAFFGPWDEHDFVAQSMRELAARRTVRAAADTGVWHLASVGATTWEELARTAARLHGYDDDRVVGVPSRSLPLRAPRPPFSALGSARGLLLPRLDDALGRDHGART